MNVYDLAHSLAREIKKSDEYKSYQEIRDKIRDNKTTLEMLRDFQKEQFKLQSKALTGEKITEEEKEKFNRLMELVNLNKDIKKYLEVEYRISVMLNDIQEIVFGDLNLGFGKEEKHPE
ncbi:MAG: YlbF family regulator [Halanaerobiales bacterium]